VCDAGFRVTFAKREFRKRRGVNIERQELGAD
jgi:hypothetical protein